MNLETNGKKTEVSTAASLTLTTQYIPQRGDYGHTSFLFQCLPYGQAQLQRQTVYDPWPCLSFLWSDTCTCMQKTTYVTL